MELDGQGDDGEVEEEDPDPESKCQQQPCLKSRQIEPEA